MKVGLGIATPIWVNLSAAWGSFFAFFLDARTTQTSRSTPKYFTPIEAGWPLQRRTFWAFKKVTASEGTILKTPILRNK
jgi:hypothetical protein